MKNAAKQNWDKCLHNNLSPELHAARKLTLLFISERNSARGQIAEALAKTFFPPNVFVASAGLNPGLELDPSAVTVLREIGLDISNQHPKSFQALPRGFLSNVDYLITLTSSPSDELKNVLDWFIPDPTRVKGQDRQLVAFRHTREIILEKLESLGKTLQIL